MLKLLKTPLEGSNKSVFAGNSIEYKKRKTLALKMVRSLMTFSSLFSFHVLLPLILSCDIIILQMKAIFHNFKFVKIKLQTSIIIYIIPLYCIYSSLNNLFKNSFYVKIAAVIYINVFFNFSNVYCAIHVLEIDCNRYN